MTLFLNGGGSDQQVVESYRLFKEKADTSKPLLYIPLAMKEEKYPSCLKWITGEMTECAFPKIDMVTSAQELVNKDFNEYGALFIGGGNTYKLLADLKSCSAYQKIQNFLEKGGTIYGGSAGAIIFGKNLDSCRHDDENKVGLQDIKGFDKVFGAYIGAHYPNGADEKIQKAADSFTKLSFESPVIALPEEDTLLIDENEVQIIGSRDFYIFKNGIRYVNAPQIYSVDHFKKELASSIEFSPLQTKTRHSHEID